MCKAVNYYENINLLTLLNYCTSRNITFIVALVYFKWVLSEDCCKDQDCANNWVSSTLFVIDFQSPEYFVIIKHYSKLVDTLTAKKLSHFFVSHNIISTNEEEEIAKPTTSSVRAATLLLSRVINPLRAGFENCTDNFYIFLDITEQYGNEDIRHLSTTIRKKVNQMKTEAEMKGVYV